ncbi:MAG: threonine synthase [Spirochaetes bacterium]|nr:MAG: threonine synthase [Spirochaetota bacterium]
MKFVSTRDPYTIVSFTQALFKGLAPDGGLYHPVEKPNLTDLLNRLDPQIPFIEIATRLTSELLGEEVSLESAGRICRKAFTFSPVLRATGDSIYILELFHGPSCAFKDFGASFLASSMEEFLQKEDRKAVILTATSGDTGSAVARAFHGKENIHVVILYPSGRVSTLQEKQLTTLGGNVIALEVKGSFDDCQKMVKQAFVDPDLCEKLTLTSANSINLGRLLPQSFYYVYAYSRVEKLDKKLYFVVPSGNFGNLTAGVLAWSWGLPVDGFIAATNRNDVVPQYLTTGIFTPRASIQTYSNAMDVGNPSNFERLKAIFNDDWKEMQSLIHGEVVTDEDTLKTISRVYREKHLFLDPHTAVGYLASERLLKRIGEGDDSVVVTLATAHPGKFLEVVEKATGVKPELPPTLKEALDLPKKSIPMGNKVEELKEFLLDTFL